MQAYCHTDPKIIRPEARFYQIGCYFKVCVYYIANLMINFTILSLAFHSKIFCIFTVNFICYILIYFTIKIKENLKISSMEVDRIAGSSWNKISDNVKYD